MLALHILFRNWSFITRLFVLNDQLIFSVRGSICFDKIPWTLQSIDFNLRI